MSLRPPIADPSASEAWLDSWPADDHQAHRPVNSKRDGMEEFGSELPRPAESAPLEAEPPASNTRPRNEWGFRVVLIIAIVEAIILTVVGLSLSGFFGDAVGTFAPPPQSTAGSSSEIRISSDPADAPVSIDGIARGTTPVVIPDLTPGSHIVSIRNGSGRTSHPIVVAGARPQWLHVVLPDFVNEELGPDDPGAQAPPASVTRIEPGTAIVAGSGSR